MMRNSILAAIFAAATGCSGTVDGKITCSEDPTLPECMTPPRWLTPLPSERPRDGGFRRLDPSPSPTMAAPTPSDDPANPSATPDPISTQPPRSPVPTPTCETDADCDDNLVCTVNRCIDRECHMNNLRDGLRPNAQTYPECSPDGTTAGYTECYGGRAEFRTVEACTTDNPCLSARCTAGKGCETVPRTDAPADCSECTPERIRADCSRNSHCVSTTLGQGVCQSRGGIRYCVYQKPCE